METCTTFGQQPPLPAPTPCVCARACGKLYAPSTNVATYNNATQAGKQFSLAKILASACLLKCKIVQLRNCFVPRDCQHSAAVSSSRSFAVFGSQFSARHLRLATLMQFALYSVCFCFCYSPTHRHSKSPEDKVCGNGILRQICIVLHLI